MSRVLKSLLVCSLMLLPMLWGAVPAGAAGPLPRSAPEAQGVSSQALLELVDELDGRFPGMHSLMVVRHGQVLAEGWWAPYAAERNHVLYSLSKSFTSTAVGLAVAEGKLHVDDLVLKFFPEDAPAEPSEYLRAMRVRDLLAMATGHQDEAPTAPAEMSAKSFLAQPVPHSPGTHFKYNTPATFMQSAIVQKVAGEPILEYLRPRLFEPLGIEHPVWDANFQGISLGGYGLRVRTEDIAKFGQLYLQRGNWEGRQIIPEYWVMHATARQVSNGDSPDSDWAQGYGYQFWRSRHNGFRGDGAFGQYCIVLPDEDCVVAITSGVGDMQAVLNVVWDKLLPALGEGVLPADAAAESRLRERLLGLQVAPVEGAATSPIVSKVLNRRFAFPENEQQVRSVALQSNDGGQSIVLEIERGDQTQSYPAGFQDWRTGNSPVPAGRLAGFPEEPTAGTFAWTSDDTVEFLVCACETPFHLKYTLKFAGNEAAFDADANVGFGPTKKPTLVGRAE